MSWFKVDDKFCFHPKVIELSLKAVGLWTKTGSWVSAQLTDGYVPKSIAKQLGGTPSIIRELTDSGLWEEADGGYRFHDWLSINPSREQIEEDRKQARERKARWRETRKANLRAL